MKKLFLLSAMFLFLFHAHAQQADEVYRDELEQQFISKHPGMALVLDSLRDESRKELSVLFAAEYAEALKLSKDQERQTQNAIFASSRRWERSGHQCPFHLAAGADANIEAARFHKELAFIFTHAQYKEYEASKLYRHIP